MEELARILRFPGTPQLPHTHGGFRQDKRPYQEILSAEDRDKIARSFHNEIALFGYQWSRKESPRTRTGSRCDTTPKSPTARVPPGWSVGFQKDGTLGVKPFPLSCSLT